MNEKIKAKWLKALRGGKYEQARSVLRFEGRYCCLGVLCDIHAKETGRKWRGNRYMGQKSHLPKAVIEWAGVPDYNPDIKPVTSKNKDVGLCYSLAEMNDGGFSFAAIAKKIEAEL